jgi:hypothetical protein
MAIDIHPLSELMKRKPREELVENLLFKKGISTMVAQAGDGKTTTGASIALLVAAGGMWGGKQIEPRPVLWIAGEGEDDLPAMVKAVAKYHGLDWEKLDIAICLEAVDFSSIIETNLLIEKLKGMPPMFIIADAFADIIGDLDEDKAKHVTQVYTNLRRVEKKTGSVILVLHHEGWKTDRERGSTAIRAKNDIMAQITEFKPDEGYIRFTHLKRRGAPKLKEFAYEVVLIPVEGCEHLVPIVTGKPKDDAGIILNQTWAADEEGARQLVQIVVQWPDVGGKPTYTRLKKRSGMTDTTFERARVEAVKSKMWLVGGGKKGYRLNPDGCWKEALGSAPEHTITPVETPPTPPPLKGGGGGGRRFSPPLEETGGETGGGGESGTDLLSEQSEEALTLTLDTAALLKKVRKG